MDKLPDWVFTVMEFLKKGYGWFRTAAMFLWAFVTSFPIPAAAILVTVIVLCVIAKNCGDSESELEKKADNAAVESIEKQSEANVTTDKIEKQDVEVKAAEKDAQNARKEREKVIKKDSKEYEPSEADEKFCQKFPADSSCADWRKRNGR